IDNGCSKPFTFNAVFDGETSQSEFFDNCGVMRLVDKALEGFACTVFAYGPTGSGKTHTITGPAGCFEQGRADQFGLIQRSFMYLFNQINSQSEDICYYLKVSYLEVYNEKVKDLLNPAGPDSLKIRWTKNKGFHVENLFTVECETIEDIMIILEEGWFSCKYSYKLWSLIKLLGNLSPDILQTLPSDVNL
ncbi:kinesin-like protein KIF12, partial [Convolutriloba macropyga]|uniref:kinesin-like protein KIF12 n=1 Tax=Convolutriloba macropyga TaxID=536237 RepID=UPI003F51D89C